MLNSAEREIFNVLKFKFGLEIQYFSGSDKPGMLSLLLMNVKLPTIAGILKFVNKKNFMLS